MVTYYSLDALVARITTETDGCLIVLALVCQLPIKPFNCIQFLLDSVHWS